MGEYTGTVGSRLYLFVFLGDLGHLQQPQLTLVLYEGTALHISPGLVSHLQQVVMKLDSCAEAY